MWLYPAQGKEERRAEQRVVEVVGIPTYIEKVKANGTFSAMIRAHVFGDTVCIEIDGEVRMPVQRLWFQSNSLAGRSLCSSSALWRWKEARDPYIHIGAASAHGWAKWLGAVNVSHFFCLSPSVSVFLLHGQVRFVFSRPFFLRGGDYMELKAAAAWYLKRDLGAAFDRADFDDAWESGCAVEVATKARKAELTGVDKKHIATTTKTITLKAEVRVMWNNARSALTTKIMMVFREENDIPPRPKGQQNQSGKKVFKIEDGPWDVVAKKMQSACN